MQTIDDYIDAAKKRNKIQSDAELGRRLGFKGSVVSQWRTKRNWPSDGIMITLAEMAGEDPKIALLDLGIWRNDGAAQGWYKDMKEMLQQAALSAAGILALSGDALARTLGEQSQHHAVVKYILCLFSGTVMLAGFAHA